MRSGSGGGGRIDELANKNTSYLRISQNSEDDSKTKIDRESGFPQNSKRT